MSNGGQRFQAGFHLRIRVKTVLQSTHRTRLVRKVGFRHADIIRAEDALSRTRIRLGQHRDGSHARKRTNRFQADDCQQCIVCRPLAFLDQLGVGCHQCGFTDVPICHRMPAHRLQHREPGPHVIQNQARQGQFFGCKSTKLLEGTFFNHYCTRIFSKGVMELSISPVYRNGTFTQYNETEYEKPDRCAVACAE